MIGWYCHFSGIGPLADIDCFSKWIAEGSDDRWYRGQITTRRYGFVSGSAISNFALWETVEDGLKSVEAIVALFPTLTVVGSIGTMAYREYQWIFDGRGGVTTWQRLFLEEVAETEAHIRAHKAADPEMIAAIHKMADADVRAGMSADEVAETEARISAYYAAFREAELSGCRVAPSGAVADCFASADEKAQRFKALMETFERVADAEDEG